MYLQFTLIITPFFVIPETADWQTGQPAKRFTWPAPGYNATVRFDLRGLSHIPQLSKSNHYMPSEFFSYAYKSKIIQPVDNAAMMETGELAYLCKLITQTLGKMKEEPPRYYDFPPAGFLKYIYSGN